MPIWIVTHSEFLCNFLTPLYDNTKGNVARQTDCGMKRRTQEAIIRPHFARGGWI